MNPKSDNPAREGGREPAKPVTSGISQNVASPRNSSGIASQAASILDLRQKVNYILVVLEGLAAQAQDMDLCNEIASYRQRGFRRGR